MQMGNLERQLLWATIDASRRRSQRAAQPSGELIVAALDDIQAIFLLCRLQMLWVATSFCSLRRD
jgi:hypothetical protein